MARLVDALFEGNLDLSLTRQDEVSEAAGVLALIEIREPVADAGANQTVATTGAEAAVTLNAGGSQAFEGRDIALYHWSLSESAVPPQGNAGSDRTVTIAGDEGAVVLDASGSQAFGDSEIVHYRWDEQ
jgi:hypothetical protein